MAAAIAFFACIFFVPMISYAANSGWRPEDTSIYTATTNPDVSELAGDLTRDMATLADGVLAWALIPLLQLLAAIINSLMLAAGISIDSVIYGRVGGASMLPAENSNRQALFTFELQPGNIYGSVSMFLYNVIFSIFITLMFCVILYRLARLMYEGGSQARVTLKDTIKTVFFCVLAMYVMPKFLDLLIYIRDVVLYTIRIDGANAIVTAANNAVSGKAAISGMNAVSGYFSLDGDYSLLNLYRINSEANNDMMNSAMYLAVAVLTLYMAFNYVGIALSLSLLVVMFPFLCVLQVAMEGKRMEQWFLQAITLIIVPIIDAILLFFPLGVGLLSTSSGATISGYSLVQFALCCSIIPARESIRRMLGLSAPDGVERAAGIGSLLAAVALGKTAVGAVKGIVGKVAQHGDKAKEIDEQAAIDKEMNQANNEKNKDALDDLEGKLDDINKKGDGNFDDVEGYNAGALAARAAEINGADIPDSQKNVLRRQAAETEKERIGNTIGNLEERKAQNEEEIAKAMEGYNDAMAAKAEAEPKSEAWLNAQAAADSYKQTAEGKRAENKAIDGRLRDWREASKQTDEAIREMNSAGGSADIERMQRFDAIANMNNYRSKDMLNNISPERRAELDQAYAKHERRARVTEGVLGTVGAVQGAGIGMAAGSMLGMSGATLGTAAGIAVGSAAGSGVGRVVANVGDPRVEIKGSGTTTVVNAEVPPIRVEAPQTESYQNLQRRNDFVVRAGTMPASAPPGASEAEQVWQQVIVSNPTEVVRSAESALSRTAATREASWDIVRGSQNSTYAERADTVARAVADRASKNFEAEIRNSGRFEEQASAYSGGSDAFYSAMKMQFEAHLNASGLANEFARSGNIGKFSQSGYSVVEKMTKGATLSEDELRRAAEAVAAARADEIRRKGSTDVPPRSGISGYSGSNPESKPKFSDNLGI